MAKKRKAKAKAKPERVIKVRVVRDWQRTQLKKAQAALKKAEKVGEGVRWNTTAGRDALKAIALAEGQVKALEGLEKTLDDLQVIGTDGK